MPACECCQPLRQKLGGGDECYACLNHTPTESGKRFSIRGSSRFCRVSLDCLIPNPPSGQAKCDYVFIECAEARPRYLFVELSGDAKPLEEAYFQIRSTILHFRNQGVLPQGQQVEGHVVGAQAPKRTSDKSDPMRQLKDRFVSKDKLGSRFIPHIQPHATLDC